MSAAFSSAGSGRAAAIERRRALSAGKSALPPPRERVRSGERSATLAPAAPATVIPVATAAQTEPAPRTESTGANGSGAHGSGANSGRAAAIERRRALSAGKSALPPPRERVRSGERSAALPDAAPAGAPTVPVQSVAAAQPQSATAAAAPCTTPSCGHASCRDQARMRRALMSQRGRGDAQPAPPSRAPRQGSPNYAPKVVASPTQGGQRVTGSRIGRGVRMTGDESGIMLPISGSQYIAPDAGAARFSPPKIGLSRTPLGGVVSGTQVRSAVRVTGDEAAGAAVTGEADQLLDDDLTPRGAASAQAGAQFQRQTEPHGHSVFGSNLGRNARVFGSRERSRGVAIESTASGLVITGSAIGRAARVTGDEQGACRIVSGDQYLTPAERQAECGGSGGGTAPAAQLGAARRDPVSGAKVSEAQTWGQQRVTGADVEHHRLVTGDSPGSCNLITGTAYQGPATMRGWCAPQDGDAAEGILPRRASLAAVSGDTPVHDPGVTGTGRGAVRDITGTPYFRAEDPSGAAAPELGAIAERFSVRSPQRQAQLRAGRDADDASSAAGRVTGSFAIGDRKVTGNLEFLFEPRRGASDAPAARSRLTGEGRSIGLISGNSWQEHGNVTGTEDFTAAERNPSARAGKPQAFAGAARFKKFAKQEDRKQLVTGMFGWSGGNAAKVTLSGGAQG